MITRRGFIAGLAALVGAKGAIGKVEAEPETIQQAVNVEETPLPVWVKADDPAGLMPINSITLNGVEVEEICPECNEVDGYVVIIWQDGYGNHYKSTTIGDVRIGGLTNQQRIDHRRTYPDRYA